MTLGTDAEFTESIQSINTRFKNTFTLQILIFPLQISTEYLQNKIQTKGAHKLGDELGK